MSKPSFLIFSFFIFSNFNLFSQNKETLIISLKEQHNWMPNYDYVYRIEQMDVDKNEDLYKLPADLGEAHQIRTYKYNIRYHLYKNYKSGKISLQDLESLRFNLADTAIYEGLKVNDLIPLLVFQKAKKRHFIVDSNKNYDFTDDKEYVFKSEELKNVPNQNSLKYIIRQRIPIDVIYNGTVIHGAPYFTIYPFNSPSITLDQPDSLAKMLYIQGISFDNIRFGMIDSNTQILVKNNFPANVIQKQRISYRILDNDLIRRQTYFQDDILFLNGVKYRVDSITEAFDKVFLRKVHEFKIVGTDTGFYAPKLTLNLMDGSTIPLVSKDKYILLDFWGTWCTPCIENHPELEAFYHVYKNKIDIISVAADDNKKAVEKYIKNKKIPWANVYEPATEGKGDRKVLETFSPGSFPLFILINNEGKILFRDSGLEGFQRLKKYVSLLGFHNSKK